MPLYEYKCSKCGSTFELLQKVSKQPLKPCPHCGGAAKRVISASTLQFKGSGWYITDYAKKEKEETKPKDKEKSKAEKDSAKEKTSLTPSSAK